MKSGLTIVMWNRYEKTTSTNVAAKLAFSRSLISDLRLSRRLE